MIEKQVLSVPMRDLVPILQMQIETGGVAELTVTGHSMQPLLFDKTSRVKLKAISAPRHGDIVLFLRQNGEYALHRIIRCAPDGTYTLCGDGQTIPEYGIRQEQMIAVVESFARRRKWQSVTCLPYRIWWQIHTIDRPVRRFIERGVHFLKRIIFITKGDVNE